MLMGCRGKSRRNVSSNAGDGSALTKLSPQAWKSFRSAQITRGELTHGKTLDGVYRKHWNQYTGIIKSWCRQMGQKFNSIFRF
jgi:hypothetical protein